MRDEDGEALRDLQELLESRGWKILERIGREQAQNRVSEVLQPTPGLGSVLEREFIKGEISGINLVLTTPVVLVKDLEAGLTVEEKVENGDGGEREADSQWWAP